MSEFIFSLDLELGVGLEHSIGGQGIDPLVGRKASIKILNMAKKYNIPLTFAVCGHLFLKECDEHNLPKPNPHFYNGDWYKNDPKSKFPKNKTWYAPDLIERIIEDEHEVACHTFSHVSFKHCNKKVAEAEIKECINIANDWGLKLDTFVFPRNEINYLDLLKKYEFTYYTSDPLPFPFLKWKLPRLSKLSKLKSSEGLTEVPRTHYLHRDKWRDIYKINLLLALAKSKDSIFHVWTHPWCLNSEKYFKIIEKMFIVVNKLKFEKIRINEIESS